MSPVTNSWAHFRPKISSKSGFVIVTSASVTLQGGEKEGCGNGSLFAFLGSARAVVGSISKIGNFLTTKILGNMSPVTNTWGPFSKKIGWGW